MAMKNWSTTASSNATVDSINFAENQLPSTVNNSARALMADVRTFLNDGGWHNWGHTTTYASSTSFRIASDETAIYTAARRIRAVGSSTGTIYGVIASSAYSSPNTTVNITWDSGSLSSETLAVSVSILDVNGLVDAAKLLSGTLPNARLDQQLQDVAGLAVTNSGLIVGDGSNFVLETGSELRTSLGLTIGTNVQAYDADLAALAGLTSASDKLPYFTGSGSASVTTFTSAGRAILDDANAAAQLVTIGAVPLAGGTMTGALTLSGDPGSSNHAANKTYVDNALLGMGKRGVVRAATTANITIATALNNGDTLDGVTLATNDLILVKDQSTASQNGVYICQASPARDDLYDTFIEHVGALIAISEGTVNADHMYLCTADKGGTLDSTSITWTKVTPQTAGTVTSIAAGAGFSFSTITSSGTIAVDGVLEDIDALGAPGSDGQFIVATGAGAFNYESGATAFTSIKQDASTTATGVSELATTAETVTGTDTARVVTPAGLHGALAGLTDATITASDTVIFADVGSSNALKEDTVQGILDLVPGAAKNLIINGDMRIAQRGTSFAGITGYPYTLDRWQYVDTGTTAAVVTVTQDTDVPTVAEAGTDFKNSLKIDVTTAETLGSADASINLQTKIEAQNCTHIGHGATGALATVLSFWMKSTKIGIWCIFVDRADASEAYVHEFTIATTNTWEFFSVVIPGDTSGTAIAADNGVGLGIRFELAIGSDGDAATNDIWQSNAGTNQSTSNQVNLLDNTSNNVLITGVQLEVGSVATDFEHRDYASEFTRCERYYQEHGAGLHGWARNTTTIELACVFPTTMRASPTVGIEDTAFLIKYEPSSQDTGTGSTIVASTVGVSGAFVRIDGFSAIAVSDNIAIVETGKVISFDAEL